MTFHHLIPRAMHGRKRVRAMHTREDRARGVDLCRDCHDAVHRFVPENELALRYSTLEALKAHPQIATFVAWVAKRSGRHRMKR